jgi:methylphosphotriester-DNA--protein-cysteine methyltransferase
MILHRAIADTVPERKQKLKSLILSGKIAWGGNIKLKIYGTLTCSSGKKMKMENRIFFESEEETLELGYRPCGHCMREKYIIWKNKKQ